MNIRDPSMSSSDELVDIEIGDSLVRETLMSIDSGNRKDEIITITIFAFALVVTFAKSFFSPPLFCYDVSRHAFTSNASIHTFVLKTKLETDYSYNFMLDFSFYKEQTDEGVGSMMYISFLMKNSETKENFVSGRFAQDVRIAQGQTNSSFYPIYSALDYNIASTLAEISLYNVPAQFSGVLFRFVVSNPNGEAYSSYFRIGFAILLILTLILFSNKLYSVPFSIWHMEQRVTLFLVISVILATIPFRYIHRNYPFYIFPLFDVVFKCFLDAYSMFFSWTIFDSLRFKNRRTNPCFFLPKLVLLILVFLTSLLSDILSNCITQQSSQPLNLINKIKVILYVFNGLCILASMIRGKYQVDVTEKYKADRYLIAYSLFWLMYLGTILLTHKYESVANSCFSNVFKHALICFFSILMVQFHWPYENLHDQMYNYDAHSQDFFSNEDLE